MLIVWFFFLHIKSLPNLLFGELCFPGDQSHPFVQPTINPLARCICWAGLLGRAFFSSLERRPEFWVLQGSLYTLPPRSPSQMDGDLLYSASPGPQLHGWVLRAMIRRGILSTPWVRSIIYHLSYSNPLFLFIEGTESYMFFVHCTVLVRKEWFPGAESNL